MRIPTPAVVTSVMTVVAGLTLLSGPFPPASADTRDRSQAPGSRGCGLAVPQSPGSSELREISSGDRVRTYQLHIPSDYDPKRRWPVVLTFHGRGSTGAEIEEFSKLSALPAIVAYPNGVIGTGGGDRQAWQGAPYAAPGVDDVAFTDDLLDDLEARLCVDRRRVYATGKSNGAGFTGVLACRSADRIAAIAPVAGAFYPTGEECHPSRPVPVIEFHGTADVTIPYAGDADRGLPAIPDWAAAWADRDGCRTGPLQQTIEPDITVSRWVGCDRGTQVSHVAVTGGGHTWPGADIYSGGGVTTQTIEAHEVLWQFLRRHRLPVRGATALIEESS